MRKWNFDTCKEEALKYNKRSDFSKFASGAYNVSCKNNWLDDICKHMPIIKYKPSGYWNIIENCKNEAIKYNTRLDFQKEMPHVYNSCIKNNWLNIVCEHMKPFTNKHKNYWTYDKCVEESLKYNTRNDFKKNSKSAYDKSCRMGWINKICKHMKIVGNKHKRLIYHILFEDNSIYIGITCDIEKRFNEHLKDIKSTVFQHIQKTKLIPELKIITDYIDVVEAKKLEMQQIKKFKKSNFNILNKTDGGELGGNHNAFTFEECQKIVLNCKNRREFKDLHSKIYKRAVGKGWLSSLFIHFPKKKTYKDFTYQECKEISNTTINRKEFKEKNGKAYKQATINNWLDEFFPKL